MLIRTANAVMRRSHAIVFAMACIVGFATIGLNAGHVTEATLRGYRDGLLARKASGNTVLIAIDSKSIAKMPGWPWPRHVYGDLVDRLRKDGVKRMAFDITFITPSSDPKEDRAFAAAIARAPGKVILPGVIEDKSDDDLDAVGIMPTPALAKNALISTIYIHLDRDYVARRYPYSKMLGGKLRPSMSSYLADRPSLKAGEYPINWAIDPETVPTVSYSDIVEGHYDPALLRGKNVLIGATAETLGDRQSVPVYGHIPGAYILAVGSETLRIHNPVPLGPLPFTVAICALLGATLFSRRRLLRWMIVPAAIVLTLVVPLVLDKWTPFQVDCVPALLAAITALVLQSLSTVSRMILQHLTRFGGSEVPNLLAMTMGDITPGVTVVVRMKNYVETTALLGIDTKGELMRRVHSRLEYATEKETIYQTDDHSFSWRTKSSVAEVADTIEGLYAIFARGITIGDQGSDATINVDATITVGICDDLTLNLEGAVLAATLAADQAAQRGLRWERYESESKDANWRLSLLSELDAALDNGDVWVAYQPKYDIATRSVTGAEALVRWTHPVRGFIAPDQFIPIVEENGRIEKLTLHVLEASIRDFAEIEGALSVAVNISARMLGHDRLLKPVQDLLTRYGMAPTRLTLEITESAEMAGDEGVAELHALRELGVAISIDDYGTGQSTLSYLKRLPATELKIDRSFVSMVMTSRSDATVVDSTIKLAHALGMKVVAEGVENQDVLEFLAAMECDQIQGYHIARPVAFKDFVVLPAVVGDRKTDGKDQAARAA